MTLIIPTTPLRSVMVMQNVYAGFVAGAAVVMILNVADGLSTYIFSGETLSAKVSGWTGLDRVTL